MSHLIPPLGPRDHVEGPADARITLVEYGDFECPHCGYAYPIVKEVQRALAGTLLFAYRHFPLNRIHEHAEHAAEIAEAAGEHNGKFWQMHDVLFEHQDALDDPQLIAHAAALGVDPKWAAAALLEGRFRSKVREDFESGVRSGVNGTPTFFINGVRFEGGPDSLLETLMEATMDAPH